jgi:flagellar biosynthetic protein FliS
MDSQFAQQAHRDYVENRVFSAHPVERVQMLYQIAIDSVSAALARFRDGDIFARGRATTKAYEAVGELNLALDHSVGASFTRTLSELYAYVQRTLVKGHSQKSEEAFQEALSVLTTLSEAWDVVVERTCGASSGRVEHETSGTEVDAEVPAVSESHSAYAGMAHEPSTSRDWSC